MDENAAREKQVERVATDLHKAAGAEPEDFGLLTFSLHAHHWRDVARYVIAEREKRERVLVEALEQIKAFGDHAACARANTALAAYRAMERSDTLVDAEPKEPTLAEAVEAMSDALKSGHLVTVDDATCVLVPRGAYNATMNALAREREKRS